MSAEKKKMIMIAEDDRFLLKAYEMKLKNEDFDISLASDGEEVIAALKSGVKPDLILLDLIMPKKRGLDALKEMKENEEWKRIPVIILTNLGQEDDVKKGLEAGARDYIVKSNISIEDVLKKIREHLS